MKKNHIFNGLENVVLPEDLQVLPQNVLLPEDLYFVLPGRPGFNGLAPGVAEFALLDNENLKINAIFC